MTTTDDRLARLGAARSATTPPARLAKLITAGLAPAAVLGITAVLARGGPAEVAAPPPPGDIAGIDTPVSIDTVAPTPTTSPAPAAAEVYLSVPPPPAAIPRAVPATGTATRPPVVAPSATAGAAPAATPAPAPAPVPAPAPEPSATTGGSH